MRTRRLYGWGSAALLISLLLFYANEIWRSSGSAPKLIDNHPSHYYQHSRDANNIFEAFRDGIITFWGWTIRDAISFYTSLLAFFTLALVTISTIQIRYLIKAERTARLTARAALRAAAAAKTQTAIAAAQTDEIIKQKSIMRLQYYANNRPTLVIRSIAMTNFEIGKNVVVEMLIANSGTTEATIKEGNITFIVSREGTLPPIPEYDKDRLRLLNPVFPSGRKNKIFKRLDIPVLEWQYDCVYDVTSGGLIYLFGFITYEDGIGNSRELGFCRRYDTARHRFILVEDQNYEYAD